MEMTGRSYPSRRLRLTNDLRLSHCPTFQKITIRGTFTKGVSGQAEAGASLSTSIGYSWDVNGGGVWQLSGGIGGGTVDVSGGLFLMITDAPDVDTLERAITTVTGGTILFFGYEYVAMYDPLTGKSYSGHIITLSASLIHIVSLEFHSQYVVTTNIG